MVGKYGRHIGNRQFVHAPRHRTLTRLHDRIQAREVERRVQSILKREQRIEDKPGDEREGEGE